jgi:hypothetical protein
METTAFNNEETTEFLDQIQPEILLSTGRPFIEANTVESTLEEIKTEHVIPVFIKDNEPVISHADFVETAIEVLRELYPSETILSPNIRLSHL